MKRFFLAISSIFLLVVFLPAQEPKTTTPASTEKKDDVLTANAKITEVRLSGFEDASFWDVSMPIDQGVISKQTRKGAPVDVSDDKSTNAIAKRDEKYGIPKNYPKEKVLGVKVQYIARGYNWFAIKPAKPIVVEGVCQSLSVYVAGRNYRHTLKMKILDYFGRERELYVGKLNFIGWRDMVASIPEQIKQTDYHYVDKQGVKFNGFYIECDPMEAFGTYYMYFDELRAITDVFNETTKDNDDMNDGW